MSDERATGAAAEHLDRIRELCSTIRWGENDYSDVLDGIQHHAEALATLAAPATGGGEDAEKLLDLLGEIRGRVYGPDNNPSRDTYAVEEIDDATHHAEALAASNAALRARLAEAEASRNRWRRAAWDTSPDGFDELIRAGEVVRVDHPGGLSYGFRESEPGDLPDAEGGDT